MVRKTETEYETVEKEIEITYCDVCGMDYDDEVIAQVVVNPELDSRRSRADNHYISKAEMFARQGRVDEARFLLQQTSSYSGRTLSTDASLDVCHGCVASALGVEDIPSQKTDFDVNIQEDTTKPDETGVRRGFENRVFSDWLFFLFWVFVTGGFTLVFGHLFGLLSQFAAGVGLGFILIAAICGFLSTA